ncbi:hypothetical protein EDF56_106438 [Novosphingobium sp. PhB165]|uniref:hypothetical protein n=1 Tax=Novosphingobium sp. PhB165 TaxID=2485105 RepID=UPI001045D9C6|nr:hypothetical protein [Novosphingobium sp. PhB165]TCM17321.1 hypothetical protein EDF56_106438 [Novosphingobium sp. PhB165]
MALIDDYLPQFQFSETHAATVKAGADAILDAVAAYRPESDPFFRAMIALRELPARLTGKRRPEPFGMANFTLLERTPSGLVYGLVGQFWQADYGLHPVADGPAFKTFDEAGVPKLALGFDVHQTHPRRRTQDRRARLNHFSTKRGPGPNAPASSSRL